jgi:aspartyl-tRNA(Asn)/glutamyl-tRNA(Gln) amidotransferase subunit A
MTDALPPSDLAFAGAHALADAFARRALSPVEYARAAIARIEQIEPRLNCFVAFTPDRWLDAARAAEAAIMNGAAHGALHGLPVAVKDIIDVAGLPTTAHSKILADSPPAAADAPCWGRLAAAGCALGGKTATHEFALGGPSFDLPWPPARNPWNPAHHPGGSSSGTGAAIAAGLLPLGLGTDTGGSVRNPASMCGIVGMKPTYGLVPRSGVVPLSFSLDHVGPMTRDVADNALLLGAIAGHDPGDPASVLRPAENYARDLHRGVRGLAIAYVTQFHRRDHVADPHMAAALDRAARLLQDAGAIVTEAALPPLAEFAAVNRAILCSEAFAIHEAWLRDRPGDYADSTRRRLLPGAFLTAADYVQAQRHRRRLADAVAGLLARHDAILCASSMDPAAPIEDRAEVERTYPRQARTVFNVTGHPALCLGVGLHPNGLPLAVQLAAGPFAEALLYRIAWTLEQAAGFVAQRPPL